MEFEEERINTEDINDLLTQMPTVNYSELMKIENNTIKVKFDIKKAKKIKHGKHKEVYRLMEAELLEDVKELHIKKGFKFLFSIPIKTVINKLNILLNNHDQITNIKKLKFCIVSVEIKRYPDNSCDVILNDINLPNSNYSPTYT